MVGVGLIPDRTEWEASCAPCRECGRRDGLDAVVDDETWAKLSGRTDGGGYLCLWCMDKIAMRLGLAPLPVRLYFCGRAMFSVPVDDFADMGWSDRQEQEEAQ